VFSDAKPNPSRVRPVSRPDFFPKAAVCTLSCTYLVKDEALALPRAAADGNDADGALDELQRRHRLGVHYKLALLVAVRQPQRPRGGGVQVAGAGAGTVPAAAAEAQHVQHLELAGGEGSGSGGWLSKMGRGKGIAWVGGVERLVGRAMKTQTQRTRRRRG
jgi:hypothetical protein